MANSSEALFLVCFGCREVPGYFSLGNWNSPFAEIFSVSAIFSRLSNFSPKIPHSILLINSTKNSVDAAIFLSYFPLFF